MTDLGMPAVPPPAVHPVREGAGCATHGHHFSHSPAPVRRRSSAGWIGTMTSATLLALLHLVAVYLLDLAYAAGTYGPWERDVVAHSGIPAGLALVVSVLSASLTKVGVKARWLHRWWYAPPAVLTATAFLRLTLLAPNA